MSKKVVSFTFSVLFSKRALRSLLIFCMKVFVEYHSDTSDHVYLFLGLNVKILSLGAKGVKLSKGIYTWLGCSERLQNVHVIRTQRVKDDF